jgi:hypothetical protein
MSACTNGGDTTIDITCHACAPLSPTAGPSATALQLEGIIAAVEALWRSHRRSARAPGVPCPWRSGSKQGLGAFYGVSDAKASADDRARLMSPGISPCRRPKIDRRALEQLWGVCE